MNYKDFFINVKNYYEPSKNHLILSDDTPECLRVFICKLNDEKFMHGACLQFLLSVVRDAFECFQEETNLDTREKLLFLVEANLSAVSTHDLKKFIFENDFSSVLWNDLRLEGHDGSFEAMAYKTYFEAHKIIYLAVNDFLKSDIKTFS